MCFDNGTINGAALENSLAVSYKAKYNLPYDPVNHSDTKYLPKCLKAYVYTDLHINVYSSFSHNCQKLEGTKMSFGR